MAREAPKTVAVTGTMLVSDIAKTRSTVPGLWVRTRRIGGTAGASAVLDSTVRSRTEKPTTMSRALSRKGRRQPQARKASRGSRADSGMNTSAPKICPIWAPWRVTEAREPRTPSGVCSMIRVDDPEISPATAKPWTSRHSTSSRGAAMPIRS